MPARVAARITTGTWKMSAHREQHGRGEAVELARLDEHVELAGVEVHEEAHRRRQHDEVAEQHARREQEGDGQPAAAPSTRRSCGLSAGRMKPYSSYRITGSENDEREVERHLDRRRERLADAQRDGIVARRVARDLGHVAPSARPISGSSWARACGREAAARLAQHAQRGPRVARDFQHRPAGRERPVRRCPRPWRPACGSGSAEVC